MMGVKQHNFKLGNSMLTSEYSFVPIPNKPNEPKTIYTTKSMRIANSSLKWHI